MTGYEVQVRTVDDGFDANGDGSDTIIPGLPATRTEYTHSGLRNGVNYFYRVRAVNRFGKGPWSDASVSWDHRYGPTRYARPAGSLSGTPPGLTLSGSTVTFTWTAPTNTGTLPITGYVVQYQRDDDDSDSDFSDAFVATILTPVEVRFRHMNVEGGDTVDGDGTTNFTWEYRVQAVNGHGGGMWTTPSRIEVPPRDPDAPELTATALGSDSIRLTWTVPTSNGTTITAYQVERKTGEGSFTEISGVGDLDATATLFVDSNVLVPATKYYYRVRAMPQSGLTGWSEESETSAATTEAAVPDRPALAAATDASSEVVPGSVSLTLTLAVNNGGSEITRYELQIWYNDQWNDADDLAASTPAQVIEGLTPGQLYYFATRAHNSAGAGQWSVVDSATASIGAPDTPVLTATPVDGESIKLTWTIPEANGATITGYTLQVWDNQVGGDWTNHQSAC